MIKFLRGSYMLFFLLAVLALPVSNADAADQYGYNDGFFIQSADDDFMLKSNLLFQTQWLGVALDNQANVATFSLVRVRPTFSGHAFGPEWSYFLEFDLATGAAALFDAYVNWSHSEAFNLMVGQFRVPFSREFLTRPQHLQFVNRSLLHTAINGHSVPVPGREVGASIWGSVADEMVDYHLAVTNGFANGAGAATAQGTRTTPTGDIDFRYTGRAVFHLMGNHGYWYSDMERSDEPNVAFGAGFNYNRIDLNADGSYDNTFGLTGDIIVAMSGFSAAFEYHFYRTDIASGGATANHQSLNFQTGYFLNDCAEVAARFAWLEPDGGSRSLAPGLALNWFLQGHNAKLQLQYDLIFLENAIAGPPVDDAKNHEVTALMQFFI